MDAFFKALGDGILNRWKRENFSLAKFPDIARAALEKTPPAEHVDLSAFLQGFLSDDEQPPQTDSPFGQPELIAYSHPRFYIQLLFWMDGTTDIHQHEFSGAFHVMHGSSIHAHYDFKTSQVVTPYLRVGDLKMKSIELLDTGRTVPIVSGSQDIHSLFHLDSPSVTVVVRTQHDPGTGPQLNYLPPHVAFDPHFSDTLMLRRKQLLDIVEQTEGSYGELVLRMVKELDFERGFSLLHHCVGPLKELGQWEAVFKAFEKKHGKLAVGVAATLEEDVRRSVIRHLRSSVTEPEHRFFLALLMNAPTRSDVLTLVQQRFEDEPANDVVMRWAEELIEVSEEGVSILDAVFPDEMELPIEDQPAVLLTAFGHLLRKDKKLPTPLQAFTADDLAALRSAFEGSTLGLLIR